MDSINEKTKQINKILNLLNKSKLSDEGFKSTKQPFFCKENKNDFLIGYKTIKEMPTNLNRNFKLLFEIVGNPEKEIYINEWTILSFNEALSQYKSYCDEGQFNVFNLAYRYIGLGHIEVLSCNLFNNLLFLRRDGGSNGWDREANHKEIIKFDYKNYKYFYFYHWYNDLNI